MTTPVAAVILTYNEQANLEACLTNLVGWCHEIFVVDSGSTDSTERISRCYQAQFVSHPYVNHSQQWQWALNNLPFTCDWVIPLDADLILSPELRQAIQQAVVSGTNRQVNGFFAAHRYYFQGKPMRGFKSYTVCLFRRQATQMDSSALVDHRFVIEGPTGLLPGTIEEKNFNDTLIDSWIDKHKRYAARIAAEEVLQSAGQLTWLTTPRLFGSQQQRIIWLKTRWNSLPLYVRPFLYFFYRYVFRLGFLDGTTGFIYHFMQALWFRLLIDVKISDLRQQIASGALSPDQLMQSFGRRPN